MRGISGYEKSVLLWATISWGPGKPQDPESNLEMKGCKLGFARFCSFLGRKTSVQVIDGDRIWFFKAELLNLQLFHCKPFKPSDLRWRREGLGGGQVSCDTSLHYVSVRVYLMVFYGIWWLLMPACMHYVSILPLLAWWHFAITTLDFATEPKWEVHGLVRKTKPCFGVTGHRMCQSSTDGPRRESTSWNTHEAS